MGKIGLKRVAMGVVALALVTGAGLWLAPRAPSSAERTPSGAGPRDYTRAVALLDAELAGARTLQRTRPGEWLFDERLANILLTRARLSGRFDDYVEAQRALDRAFAAAPPGAGPHQTQMALAFSLHRLAQAETMIAAIERYAVRPERETRMELQLTRGDIAFYRGDYAGALRLYRRSEDEAGAGPSLRIANLLARTGEPDEALATIDRFEAAAKLPTAQLLADLALRRGTIEMQRGAWEEADRHFERATRLFPGWWLAEALRAQMLAATGRYPDAIAAFHAILRSNASPEAMDALASLYRAQGDGGRARLWSMRAGRIWAQRLTALPEATLGHAAEHELAFGDARRALSLARRDFAQRPYGQSATTLAWALLAVGDAQGALGVLDPAIAAGWTSSEIHLAKQQALLLLGRATDAEAERAAALAINPRATDPAASLIWLGH